MNIEICFETRSDRDKGVVLLINAIEKEIEYIERDNIDIEYRESNRGDSLEILNDIKQVVENYYEG